MLWVCLTTGQLIRKINSPYIPMGHCQKSQNNTHPENQILQKTSDYQSVRLPWTCPCAQAIAEVHFLQQEISDINHPELR